MKLQHHPGEPGPPVSTRWSGGLEDLSTLPRMAAGVCILLGGGLALAAVYGGAQLYNGTPAPALESWPVIAAAGLASLPFLGLLAILALWGMRARVRDQTRYYKLGKVQPLSPEQRAALQLDVLNATSGVWMETLEYWPCERRVGDVRFGSFELATPAEALEALERDWGVVDRESWLQTANALVRGLHSQHLAREMAGDAAPQVRADLSALTGLPPQAVDQALKAHNGAPALVWAWDLARVIPHCRNGYTAGLITEAEAWGWMLSASETARTLYPTRQAFLDGYRLGHAFWAGDPEACGRRLEATQAYQRLGDLVPWQPLPFSALSEQQQSRLRAAY
ncbi:MAG: DUF1266 domain-containing protein [Myxococcota bacterium]|nr:DUF1266 domain-containing protein [Myxococcota bacterium]